MTTATTSVSEQIETWWRGLLDGQRREHVTWQVVLEEVLCVEAAEAEPMLFRRVDEAMRVLGLVRKRVRVGDTRVWAWVRE